MQKLRFALLLSLSLAAGTVVGGSTTGCGVPAKTIVDMSLTGAQYACVLLTSLWDAPAIATACQIANQLIPEIRNVLTGKATAMQERGEMLPPEARAYLQPESDAGKE